MWLGVGWGGRGADGQFLTRLGIQKQRDPSSPPSTSSSASFDIKAQECLQNCFLVFFSIFLQEMKRSSVQRASEGFSLPSFSLLRLDETEGRREEGVGRGLAQLFEVREVKITGTGSRLNRRFHLPGQIKAPTAGAPARLVAL